MTHACPASSASYSSRCLLQVLVCGLLTLLAACSGGGSGTAGTSSTPLAVVESIEVTPANAQVAAGMKAQLSATALMSDGTHQDITAGADWTSSNPDAATISNSDGSKGLTTALSTGATTISARTAGVVGRAKLAVTAAVLTSIEVTPPTPSVAKGTAAQFTATGVFSDRSTQNLTSQVTWTSSDASVATISSAAGSSGLAMGTAVGSARISALLNGVTSPSATLTVTAATLVSIQVTPPSPSLPKGLSQQFTATGVYTDTSTQNLTSMVTWSSSDSNIAGISNTAGSTGLASAKEIGSASVSASLGGITSPDVTLTVTAATLAAIEITPPTPTIANGLSQQFTATGVYTDTSTQNLTSTVTWSSSDSSVAAVSNASGSNGLAAAVGVGSSSISASLGLVVSSSVTLTVTAASLVSIQVTPPNPSIANGLTQQFTATGTFTDHTTSDLTQTATWSSSLPAVATISNASGSNGLASSASTGATDISATFGGVTSPTVSLTVTAATLASIEVTPPDPSIANGLTQQFTATGIYTDGSTQDLTQTVTWASATAAVASISNAAGSRGLASSSATGSTDISASSGGITSPNVTLSVTAATLKVIEVTPPSPSIANGLTQQFTAIGVYSDQSTKDLSASVTWSSSDGTVASISNATGSGGLATATGVGSTDISASYTGITSPAATLTVTAATLVAIQVTPPAPSIANGLTQQFAATGVYTDNSTQDLTALAAWLSSDTGVASVSSAPGSNGLATGTGVGSTDVSATYNGITSPGATLTVTAATLASIQVTPPAPVLANGLTLQFAATGTYTDGSTQDLTASVTWASSDGSVASISNAAGSNGLASSSSVGTSNISASLNGVSSPAAALTVTAAALASIQVTPSAANIANGLTQPFTATGTYTDNSTQDLTALATWASSDTTVATVSNAAGSNGLATAAAVGSTNISATYSGVTSPAAGLTVVTPIPATAGVWTATPAADEGAGMISDGAGNFFFFTSSANCFGLYNGTLAVSGSTVSGSGFFAPSVFGPNSGCPAAVHENYTGSVVPGVSMTLSAAPAGGGDPAPTIIWTFSSIYYQPSAVTLLAGNWVMQGGSVATISSGGVISGLDASTGCAISGHVSVSDTTVNLYNVSVTYSGCTGGAAALNGIALSGLGTLVTSGTSAAFDVGVRSANKKTQSVFFWAQQ